MTAHDLAKVLRTLPKTADGVIVRGRETQEIFASLPLSIDIPKGWSPASTVHWMYPGKFRVRYHG